MWGEECIYCLGSHISFTKEGNYKGTKCSVRHVVGYTTINIDCYHFHFLYFHYPTIKVTTSSN